MSLNHKFLNIILLLFLIGLGLNSFYVHLLDNDNKVLANQIVELQMDTLNKQTQFDKLNAEHQILGKCLISLAIENENLHKKILQYQEQRLERNSF